MSLTLMLKDAVFDYDLFMFSLLFDYGKRKT